MWLHLSIDALIGPDQQSETLSDIGVETPISTCPIRVLTKKADAPRYEDLHDPSSLIRVARDDSSMNEDSSLIRTAQK
jgi:hypothetical protein